MLLSDWRSFELSKLHCWTLPPQKFKKNWISCVITPLKRTHLWFFFLAESFYVKLVKQTALPSGLFSCRPVSQIQPSVIFIAFRLILMKLLCDQRRVQHSVLACGAELEVKSIVQSCAPFLIVSILINGSYSVKRHWWWKTNLQMNSDSEKLVERMWLISSSDQVIMKLNDIFCWNIWELQLI